MYTKTEVRENPSYEEALNMSVCVGIIIRIGRRFFL